MNARKLFISAALSAAALSPSVAPGLASADVVTDYPPAPDARSFASSDGGWTAGVERSNVLCLPGVTCPQVTGFHVGTGGTAGANDGFLRSSVVGLGSLLTTTRTTWTSPNFVYNGAGGAQPTSVQVSFGARNDANALIDLLSDVDRTVLLDDLALGATTVIPETDVAKTPAWGSGGSAAIAPGQLVLGHEYRIRLVTDLDMPVALVPSGTFDVDDVVLRATKTEAPGGTTPGGGGGAGSGGGGDDGGGSSGTANNGGNSGAAPGGLLSATLRGGYIYVKVKCKKQARAKCKFKLTAREKGKRSTKATKAGKAKVKPGKRKTMKLKVKRRSLAKLESAKKVMFTGTVKAGPVKAKVAKRLKLRHG